MNIAIIADELAPGSAPKLLGLKVKYLEELGHKVTLLIINDNGLYEKNKTNYDQFLKNVEIRYLIKKFPKLLKKINFKFPFMSFFSLHHISSIFFAHRSVKYEEFDLCIACCQYTTFAASNIKRKKNIKFLLLIWDPSTFIAKKIYKKKYPLLFPFLHICAIFLDKFAVKLCECLITSSLYHHQKYKLLTSKPLEIIHLGCFPNEFYEEKKYGKKNYILTFDRWDLGNDPKQILDILNDLKRKDIYLYIGGYWYQEELKSKFDEYANKLNIQDRVEHIGYLNEKQIKYYSSKSLINIHHIHDAFATTILETSGYGCPGIVPRGCGVDEIFLENESILLVDDFETNSFVKKLDYFFEFDERDLNRFSKNAWSRAKDNSWQMNYGKKLEDVIMKYV